MNELVYTSIHQLTNLFIEYSTGKVSNSFVESSVQGFVYDLEKNTFSKETEVVKECIEEYIGDLDLNEIEIKELKNNLINAAETLTATKMQNLRNFLEKIQ